MRFRDKLSNFYRFKNVHNYSGPDTYVDFYIAPRCQAVTYWLSIIIYYLCYQTFLTNFRALYLTQFLTDFRRILDSESYNQAQETL